MKLRIVLLAGVIAAVLGASREAGAAETVHIGITGISSDITLFLAEKQGYFHDAGIEADFVPFQSAAKMIAPLGIGELQVGAGAPSSGLYNAEQRGVAIKIVADKATATPEYSYKALLVRKVLVLTGAFKTLADLKGRKVAVVAQGASDNSILNEALKTGGLTMKDVDRVYIGFAQQPIALENGAIDAAIEAEPNVTQALRLGVASRFTGTASFYPDQASAVILYGGDFIKNHRATATKFMTAYLRAVRDYDAALKGGRLAGPGADKIIELLTKVTKISDPSVFRDMVPSWCNPDGKVSLPSMDKDLAFFKAEGEVAPDVTVAQVLDTSFVDAAVKALGPARR